MNMIDPIMGKIDALPMQQHHILQLAEFFTSTAAHYVISMSRQMNNYSHSVHDDKLYILCGTLHKFKVVLTQYLDRVDIVKRYEAAAEWSRDSSITRHQHKETILDKLNCAAVFNLIEATLEETAAALAVQIGHKVFVHQRLIAIVWKQPINEPLSNEQLKDCMKKYIWNQIIPNLKDVQHRTTPDFFNVFCFEAHRAMLKTLQSAVLPLAPGDVLSFVQVLRVKHALNSVVQYMIECWKLNAKEVMESSQATIIREMVRLSLSETQALRQSLRLWLDKEKESRESMQICKALRVLVQARSNTLRTSSARPGKLGKC